MIQLRSMISVADNSGAKIIGVIRILKGHKGSPGEVGDVVVGSVKEAEPRKAVKKKDIVRALIVRQKKPLRRKDGSYVRFDDNAVVVIEGKEPKATRVFGPIAREIKEKGFNTIASMAEELV
ncbi:MAG: 50S ribosomal protein L14 [Parcubacteria group bacterium]|nr:50S ribosomal protein L14 [Parcubacteria group bacterium]